MRAMSGQLVPQSDVACGALNVGRGRALLATERRPDARLTCPAQLVLVPFLQAPSEPVAVAPWVRHVSGITSSACSSRPVLA